MSTVGEHVLPIAFCIVIGVAIVGCSSEPEAPTTLPTRYVQKPKRTPPPPPDSAPRPIVTGATGPHIDHNITGIWEGSDKSTYTFFKDGTFTSESPRPEGVMTMVCRYKLEDDKVNLTIEDLRIKAADPNKQADIDAKLQEMKAQIQPETDAIAWKSNDELTMMHSGSPVVLRRRA